ncbi:unnamed protein product [Rhizophagus irregularis]|nr:unnamed protein product [Rhizophagus irregularis]
MRTAIKGVVNELILHRKAHFHENILKFYGVTKEATCETNNYALVLEYADSASAVYCLHENDIIHRDLHANNILIHQKNIKVADFDDFTCDDVSFLLSVISGRRGEIINGTPIEYSNLYTRCWKYEPNERPHMEELVSTLKLLKNNYFNERKEDNSSIKNNYNLEVLSKRTTDLNYSSQYKSGSNMQIFNWHQIEAGDGNKTSQYRMGDVVMKIV